MNRLRLLKIVLFLVSLGGCCCFLSNYSARDGGGPWAENGAKTWIIAGVGWAAVFIVEAAVRVVRAATAWIRRP